MLVQYIDCSILTQLLVAAYKLQRGGCLRMPPAGWPIVPSVVHNTLVLTAFDLTLVIRLALVVWTAPLIEAVVEPACDTQGSACHVAASGSKGVMCILRLVCAIFSFATQPCKYL